MAGQGGRAPIADPRRRPPAVRRGLYIGYRAYDRDGRQARFAFGHGLGYTTWELLGLDVVDTAPGGDVTATVRVRNSVDRDGRHVVQLYLARPDSAIERVPRWLAGFATVDAAVGEEVNLDVVVPARAFEHWDSQAGRWSVEPGEFEVHAGSSIAELPLCGSVTVGAREE